MAPSSNLYKVWLKSFLHQPFVLSKVAKVECSIPIRSLSGAFWKIRQAFHLINSILPDIHSMPVCKLTVKMEWVNSCVKESLRVIQVNKSCSMLCISLCNFSSIFWN
ncbi:hypothetical protein MKW92_029787, partial [Papaver armeniacum]